LQGNEGSVDPIHTSFVHRLMEWEDPTWMRIPGAEGSHQELLLDTRPTIEVEKTDFGLTVYTLRQAGEGHTFVRVESVLFPNAGAYGGPAAGPEFEAYGINWHVPIDDQSHWKYLFVFSNKDPLDKAKLKSRMGDVTPDYHLVRNKRNRFLQDREQMQKDTFSGLGMSFNEHDAMAIETMGPIVDRTNEHLGVEDKAIITYRRMLLDAMRDVEDGNDPPWVVRSPYENHWEQLAGHRVISSNLDWHTGWKKDSEAADTVA
jgi:hypothetical protein